MDEPIDEADVVEEMPTLAFRPSVRFFWRWLATWGVGAGAAAHLVSSAARAPVPPGMALGMALGAVLLLAAVLLPFPVYVRADGVRGYTHFGFYYTVRWQDIAEARPDGMAGIHYLVLTRRGGWFAVLVPVYLSDMPGFARAVRACAGPDNPLSKALSGY